VDCNCSNIALVNGDSDLTYTVSLVANDGIANSATVTFALTMTSPNKAPEFYNLVNSLTVDKNTSIYILNLQYRDLNTADLLVYTQNIADPVEALTFVSAASSGDSVAGGFSLGGQDLVFDFTGFFGTVTFDIVVTDNNSVGGALGVFNDA